MKRFTFISLLIIIFIASYSLSYLYAWPKIALIDIIIHISMTIVSFILAIFLSIIMHELGHLVMGKISGYKLISFRILNYVYQDHKWEKNPLSIKGFKGQCLMYYENYHEKAPFVLYNLGGSLNNLFLGLISLIIILISNNYYLNTCLISLFFISFYLVVINLHPSILYNDGSNILAIKKHKEAHLAFFDTLRLQQEISLNNDFLLINLGPYTNESAKYHLTLMPRLFIFMQLLKKHEYQKIDELMKYMYIYSIRYPALYFLIFIVNYMLYQVLVKNNPNLESYYKQIPKQFLKYFENLNDSSIKIAYYFYLKYSLKDDSLALKIYHDAKELILEEENTSYQLFLLEILDYQIAYNENI